MIRASGCFLIGPAYRRFPDRKGLVHVGRVLYQSVPRTQARSQFVGVQAFCGLEVKADPKRRGMYETRARPTCVACVARAR